MGAATAHGPAPDGSRGLIRLRYSVLPTGDHVLAWMSRQPIPGGVAFENFEMRERFHRGQRFIFGITRRTPGDMGLGLGDRQRATYLDQLLARLLARDTVEVHPAGRTLAKYAP